MNMNMCMYYDQDYVNVHVVLGIHLYCRTDQKGRRVVELSC